MTSFLPIVAMAALLGSAVGLEAAVPPSTPVSHQTRTQPVEEFEMILFQSDPHDRMTIPIQVAGGGMLDFMIDTGAEKSAISREAAARLQLPNGRTRTVMTFAGLGRAQSVHIPMLEVGGRVVENVEALTFRRAAMGADGLLGIDSFHDQLVSFNFETREIDVRPSPKTLRRGNRSDVLVDLEDRSGRMVMTGARHGKIKLDVMIDTGAGISVGNVAFRRALIEAGKMPLTKRAAMLTVTGQVVPVDYGVIRNVMIDDITIVRMPIALGVDQPFDELGLGEKPAIILGMGTLKSFASMDIDYKHLRARFTAPSKSQFDPSSRFAFVE